MALTRVVREFPRDYLWGARSRQCLSHAHVTHFSLLLFIGKFGDGLVGHHPYILIVILDWIKWCFVDLLAQPSQIPMDKDRHWDYKGRLSAVWSSNSSLDFAHCTDIGHGCVLPYLIGLLFRWTRNLGGGMLSIRFPWVFNHSATRNTVPLLYKMWCKLIAHPQLLF